MCWIDTYLGPPDQIVHNAGTNFIAKEFSQFAGTIGIQLKATLVEAYNLIGIVEHYYIHIRYIYLIILAKI